MQTVWENETGASTLPLPHMLQNFQRIWAASVRRYARSAGSCVALLAIDREGNSIRSTERITGVHRDTILALLVMAGVARSC